VFALFSRVSLRNVFALFSILHRMSPRNTFALFSILHRVSPRNTFALFSILDRVSLRNELQVALFSVFYRVFPRNTFVLATFNFIFSMRFRRLINIRDLHFSLKDVPNKIKENQLKSVQQPKQQTNNVVDRFTFGKLTSKL
jgi:hypothetical protein